MTKNSYVWVDVIIRTNYFVSCDTHFVKQCISLANGILFAHVVSVKRQANRRLARCNAWSSALLMQTKTIC